jgi:hypothetical protein
MVRMGGMRMMTGSRRSMVGKSMVRPTRIGKVRPKNMPQPKSPKSKGK